ncbi:MAG: hypothetical protein JNM94_03915 [Phycisphaerae bacterium]|nr:hypothetical protein [Phycisphaerae bacterium]
MPAHGPNPGSGFRNFLFLVAVFAAAFGGGYAGVKWGTPKLEKPDGPLIPYVGTAGVPVKVELAPPTAVFTKGLTPPSSTTLKLSGGANPVMLRVKQSGSALVGLPVDLDIGANGNASIDLVLSPDAPTGSFYVTLVVLEKNTDGAWIETDKQKIITFTVQ